MTSPTTSNLDHAIDLTRSVADIDRLRLVLLRLARRIRTRASGSITPSQLAVLGSIIRHERLTVGQIAEHEHVTPPSASKIVAALERTGFVERTIDPDDRRCTPITVTDAGLAYADEVRAAGRTWLADQLEHITSDEIDAIGAALPALERLLGGPE